MYIWSDKCKIIWLYEGRIFAGIFQAILRTLDCSDFCPGSTASKYFTLPPFTINGDFIPDNIEFLKRLIGNNLHKAGNKNSIFHCSRVTGDIETWDMRHRDRVRGQWQWTLCWAGLGWVASISAANRSIGSTTGCTITEKAPTSPPVPYDFCVADSISRWETVGSTPI